MKIGYFGIALCATALSATTANAQINAFSALNLTSEDPTLGSARYSGMGGAMGAIGGGTSSLKDNAASIATSTKSDIGVTFDLYSNNDGQCSFAVSDASLLFNIEHNNSGYMSSAIAIAYNRNRTYDRSTYREVTYKYQDGASTLAKDRNDEEGGCDAVNFAYAGNINNMLYFGVALGITNIRYEKASVYSLYSPMYYDNLGMHLEYPDDYLGESKGTGCNFNLGFIFQPSDVVRFGFGLQTPTLYNIHENWSFYQTDGFTEEGEQYCSGEYWDHYDYKIHTPMKFSAQLGFMLGERVNIDVDYSMRNYTRMWGEDHIGKMRELEKDIKATMQTQHTLKVGAEVNIIDGLDIRAGYAMATAPIKGMEVVCDELGRLGGAYSSDFFPRYSVITPQVRHYASAGFGYSGKVAYVDFAYIRKIANEQYIEQVPESKDDCIRLSEQFESQKNGSNHFMLSLGFHF